MRDGKRLAVPLAAGLSLPAISHVVLRADHDTAELVISPRAQLRIFGKVDGYRKLTTPGPPA
jgi:hypothetical protein